MEKKAKRKWAKILGNLFLVILFFVAFSSLAFRMVMEPFVVSGSSMANTLKHGDYGYYEKGVFGDIKPKRFEIIIFKKADSYIIKRVIAFGGERVLVASATGDVFINDRLVPQKFITDSTKKLTCSNSGQCDQTILLDQNEYFVLGDNRSVSKDSLHGLGTVHQSELTGILRMITATCGQVNETGNVCSNKKATSWRFY